MTKIKVSLYLDAGLLAAVGCGSRSAGVSLALETLESEMEHSVKLLFWLFGRPGWEMVAGAVGRMGLEDGEMMAMSAATFTAALEANLTSNDATGKERGEHGSVSTERAVAALSGFNEIDVYAVVAAARYYREHGPVGMMIVDWWRPSVRREAELLSRATS